MKQFLDRWMPIDASAHGAELDSMNALVHWLMLILFVGWGAYFVYVLFRFRAGRNPVASYTGSKSKITSWTEIAIVVAEVLLLVVFAIPAWARWVTPHPPGEDTLFVKVIGEQFAWNVLYPGADGEFGRRDAALVSSSNPVGLDRGDPLAQDDIVSVNQLHLPVNRPITVLLSTKDVIHSFSLPVMRVKQDAIPGSEMPVHFTATMATPAESQFPMCAADAQCWEIACAQLCGLGHYRMRGFLTVHEEGKFEEWLAAQAAKLQPPAPAPAEAAEPDGEPATEPAAGDHATG